MKKMKWIGFVAALAAVLFCFGCRGPAYTEVEKADYARTMQEFEPMLQQVGTLDLTDGWEIRIDSKNEITTTAAGQSGTNAGVSGPIGPMTAKAAEAAEKAYANISGLMKTVTADGKLTLYMKLTIDSTMRGTSVKEDVEAYVADGFMYAKAGENKFKTVFDIDSNEYFGNIMDQVDPEIDFDDVSGFEKLEVAGKEGENRYIRVTAQIAGSSDIAGIGASVTMPCTLALGFDKDGKLTSMEMSSSVDTSMEMGGYKIAVKGTSKASVKPFSGTISLPKDLDSYTAA